jgi:shikimate kinase
MSGCAAGGASGRTLLLAGMMGTGKSTVGRLLAARLGRAFIDTDAQIEAQRGLSVAQIFAREGEAAFRAAERAVLAALPERGAVVALGGGALLAPEARALARARGLLVWLAAEPDTLLARIAADGSRPLLAGLGEPARLARLRELCAARAPAYAEAELRIDTDGRSAEQVCAVLLGALGEQGCAAAAPPGEAP